MTLDQMNLFDKLSFAASLSAVVISLFSYLSQRKVRLHVLYERVPVCGSALDQVTLNVSASAPVALIELKSTGSFRLTPRELFPDLFVRHDHDTERFALPLQGLPVTNAAGRDISFFMGEQHDLKFTVIARSSGFRQTTKTTIACHRILGRQAVGCVDVQSTSAVSKA